MPDEELEREIADKMRIQFTLAGGPGGQNVNKVNTRVTGHLRISDLVCLSEEQKERVREKLYHRINAADELYLAVHRHRTQGANRRELLAGAAALIQNALVKTPPRHRTKPSRASRERRLEAKKRLGERKKNRRRPEL
jgi:ribosome-associated protein